MDRSKHITPKLNPRINVAMKDAVGYLTLVLHAHLPFIRHPEYPDFLEEDWFYEAVTETYVPLLSRFEQLRSENIKFRVTMTVTPPLVCRIGAASACARAPTASWARETNAPWPTRRIGQLAPCSSFTAWAIASTLAS